MEEQNQNAAWLKMTGNPPVPIKDRLSVGRSKMRTIVVEDEDIGKHHFEVQRQDEGGYLLVDMGSLNGTYVNGEWISQPVRLRDGDKIQAGSRLFEFSLDGKAHPERSTKSSKTVRGPDKEFPSWLLVSDVVGSTALSKTLPPAEHKKMLDDWMSLCTKAVETHDGRLYKFMGDGFLAYWRDDAPAAQQVLGALATLQEIRRCAQLAFRLVAHYGTVTAGAVGTLRGVELVGKEVNLACRMEKLAKSLGQPLLFSETAAERLASLRAMVSVGRHEVEGLGAFEFFTFKE